MREAGAVGRRWFPYACVLAAAVLWGTIGVSYDILLDRVRTDEVTLVTIRATAAAALLWAWLGVTDRAALRVRRADLPFLLAFGLVTVTVFYLALIYAFDRTSVAVGTLLLYLAPAFVTLGAALCLGEALTGPKLAALGLSLAGCLLVVEAYQPANLQGNAAGIGFGLLAAASYAAYSLMGKPLLARYRPPTVLAYHLAVGAAGLLIVKVATTPAAWPAPGGLVIVAAYSGIVITLAPISLYTLGLRRLPSSEASILATLEPVVAIGLAAWLLGESLQPLQAVGAAGVLGGVVLLATRGTGRGGARPHAEGAPRGTSPAEGGPLGA